MFSGAINTQWPSKQLLKGSVQRKLRWVENGVIRRVWASYRGAGYYFVILGGLRLSANSIGAI
jgi:hypothetical protein